jgi:SAM-dependent methyltransferase
MSHAGHFTSVAREYADFRPGYPPELFDWLAGSCAARDAVWDCGCGSGQASRPLAAHFAQVFATDVAAEQIAAAKLLPNIRYSVAPAEHSGLADGCVDLVVVAQALHWFDVAAFYAEARRVARPGALIAVWTYPLPILGDAALNERFVAFYRDVVGPYWPPERKHVEAGYRSLPFPFPGIPVPGFSLTLEWSLERVVGYASSWSASARYRAARGEDPVPHLRRALEAAWPAAASVIPVSLPLRMRVGRLDPSTS